MGCHIFEPVVIPRFDGGLNFLGDPIALQDHEWTWSDGFEPRDGTALQMLDLVTLNDGTWLPASHFLIGIVQDCRNAGDLLLTVGDTGRGTLVDLYSRNHLTGVFALESATTAAAGNTVVPLPAVLGNLQLLVGGGQGAESVFTWNGSTTALVNPSGFALTPTVLVVAQGHALAVDTFTAADRRSVWISDALDGTVWDPGIGNSADIIDLDAQGDIVALAESADGAVVITTNEAFLFHSTGGVDPPFTVVRYTGGGCPYGIQRIVHTSSGTIYLHGDHLASLGGSPVPGGEKCSTYFLRGTQTFNPETTQFIWDPRRSAIIMPRVALSGPAVAVTERMYFEPTRQVWWRKSQETPLVTGLFHSFIHTFVPEPAGGGTYYAAIAGLESVNNPNAGLLMSESTVDPLTSTAGMTNAFVDTKDFSFSSPSVDDYYDRIVVDWERYTSDTTLAVYAYVRETLFPSGHINLTGNHTDFSAQFTLLGTLQDNQSEVRIRRRGAYARFRFQVTAGRGRIRGFTLYRQRGSDRPKGS